MCTKDVYFVHAWIRMARVHMHLAYLLTNISAVSFLILTLEQMLGKYCQQTSCTSRSRFAWSELAACAGTSWVCN